ncbi:MAG: hypothetical protein EOO00_07120 [Chitinophagaceae bacterium]|nr:MAG: hypothetical protein EOO00_07120 [Chitinophagaceae bacterium]
MRTLLIIFGCLYLVSGNAQQAVPMALMNNSQMGAFPRSNMQLDSNSLNRNWSLNKYAGLSSGFGFFNGANTTMLSAPIGMQLNRRLNKNLYAFAGISVAPSYFTYNRSFNDFNIYKSNSSNTRINSNGFGIYSRAEAGLMYINDERTFSISGSIGVDRSSYPIYPSNRLAPQTQPTFIGSR